MSGIYKKGNAQIRGNLTPMIDMAFLLIVFFVLVSRLVDFESVPMDLPQPTDAVTVAIDDQQRVVINVMPSEGGLITGYRVGSADFAPGHKGITGMRQLLTNVYQSNPGVKINVRADRSTHYELVEPVLQTVAEAARDVQGRVIHPNINLVVYQDD